MRRTASSPSYPAHERDQGGWCTSTMRQPAFFQAADRTSACSHCPLRRPVADPDRELPVEIEGDQSHGSARPPEPRRGLPAEPPLVQRRPQIVVRAVVVVIAHDRHDRRSCRQRRERLDESRPRIGIGSVGHQITDTSGERDRPPRHEADDPLEGRPPALAVGPRGKGARLPGPWHPLLECPRFDGLETARRRYRRARRPRARAPSTTATRRNPPCMALFSTRTITRRRPVAPCGTSNQSPIALEPLPVDEHLRAIVGVDLERGLRRDREILRVPQSRIRTRHAVRKRHRLADRRHLRGVGYQPLVRAARRQTPTCPALRQADCGRGRAPLAADRPPVEQELTAQGRASTTSSTYVTTTPSRTRNDRAAAADTRAVADSSPTLHSRRVPSPQLSCGGVL